MTYYHVEILNVPERREKREQREAALNSVLSGDVMSQVIGR